MAKNSFDFEAHLSRHSHNVSAGYTSSLVTGPIVPQYFDILGPGDSLYFTPKCFARLQDIVAPFFGEVDIHFDAFFVPLQMLYTPFGQVFAQTNDVLSSMFAKNTGSRISVDSFPMIDSSIVTEENNLADYYYGHKECFGKETMRLLDSLDCNCLGVLTASNGSNTTDAPESLDSYLSGINVLPDKISPFAFAAYQAIYQKFFRNDDYETFDIGSYNFDKEFPDDDITDIRFFRLRYCQRPVDYFTSVKVSPISSAVNCGLNGVAGDDPDNTFSRFPRDGSSLLHTLQRVNDYLGFNSDDYRYLEHFSEDISVYPDNGGVLAEDMSKDSISFLTSSSGHNVSWFPSAANIRALFAVDKFTRIYGRAGKTYDEQILAHFGIKIPHDVKHDLTHIKHWRMSLVAEPVYSTADTGSDGSSIGQVGGQANNTLNASQEKFTAPVHGVFMIVCYANTKPRYFGTFSKLNTIGNRLDFPIPEFDKLGMQPLYAYEVNNAYLVSDGDNDYPSVRIGWQRRYQQFKQKYNRLSPLYFNTDWIKEVATASNAFSPYVLGRTPFNPDEFYFVQVGELVKQYESFLIPAIEMFETPLALNGVMAVEYNGQWSNDYWKSPQSVFDTDPIIMDFYCDAKKVSWMSETGEPDL